VNAGYEPARVGPVASGLGWPCCYHQATKGFSWQRIKR
jgi:hypothetical protein